MAAALWLKSRPDCTGRIGVTGFCYGGGISNTLAVTARRRSGRCRAVLRWRAAGRGRPEDQGGDPRPSRRARHASGRGLAGVRGGAEGSGRHHEGYIYPGAVHGFNNDATPERYNKAAADLAWQRTIDWFNKYVRGGRRRIGAHRPLSRRKSRQPTSAARTAPFFSTSVHSSSEWPRPPGPPRPMVTA